MSAATHCIPWDEGCTICNPVVNKVSQRPAAPAPGRGETPAPAEKPINGVTEKSIGAAPAGLPTPSEIDAMNIYKPGGVMDCIRHSEGCSIWRGPGGCSCGAIEAGRVVRRLVSLARLAVEAQQDRARLIIALNKIVSITAKANGGEQGLSNALVQINHIAVDAVLAARAERPTGDANG